VPFFRILCIYTYYTVAQINEYDQRTQSLHSPSVEQIIKWNTSLHIVTSLQFTYRSWLLNAFLTPPFSLPKQPLSDIVFIGLSSSGTLNESHSYLPSVTCSVFTYLDHLTSRCMTMGKW